MITNTPTKYPFEAEYFGPKVKSRRSSAAILEKNESRHSSNIAKEYFNATSLHGLKYIAEDERHPIERVLWVILCVASFAFMVYLILPICEKYRDYPTVTTVIETNYPVYKVDFPAVTICSNNKVIEKSLDRLLSDSNGTLAKLFKEINGTYNDTQIRNSVKEVVETYTFFDDATDKMKQWSGPEATLQRLIIDKYTDEIPSIMREVMQKCNNMIMACEWQGKIEKCSEMFSITRTDAGFCCSFNVVRPGDQMNSEDEFDYDYKDIYDDDYWNYKDKQDSENRKKRSLPNETIVQLNDTKKITGLRRTNSASSVLGLNILLYQDHDDYKGKTWTGVVQNSFLGFKVLVHDPYAFPQVSGRGMSVGINQEAFVSVHTTIRESDKAVKKMSLSRRRCLSRNEDFDETGDEEIKEYKPKYFSVYTMRGCIMECRATYSMEKCGCIPYYYPELSDTNMCNVEQLECLANISGSFYALGIPRHPDGGYMDTYGRNMDDETDYVRGKSCECPPDCDQTLYTQEQSQAALMPELGVQWLEKKYKKSQEQFYNTKGKCCANAKVKDFVLQRELDHPDMTENNTETQRRTNDASKLVEGMSLIHVYFKELEVVKYSKQENYAAIDLIAAFGGVVGLCIGFSFLSGAEFIYFFTIRILFDKIKRK